MFDVDERQRRNVVVAVVAVVFADVLDFTNALLALALLLACMRQADLAMFLESMFVFSLCVYIASELAVWKSLRRFFRRSRQRCSEIKVNNEISLCRSREKRERAGTEKKKTTRTLPSSRRGTAPH